MDFYQAMHWIDRKAAALQQTRVKINRRLRQKKDLILLTSSPSSKHWNLEEHLLISLRLITALGLTIYCISYPSQKNVTIVIQICNENLNENTASNTHIRSYAAEYLCLTAFSQVL